MYAYVLIGTVNVYIKLSIRLNRRKGPSEPFVLFRGTSDVYTPPIRSQQLPQPPAMMRGRGLKGRGGCHSEL